MTIFSLKYENYINIFNQRKSESPLSTDCTLLKIFLKIVLRRKRMTREVVLDEILKIRVTLEADWVCDIQYFF